MVGEELGEPQTPCSYSSGVASPTCRSPTGSPGTTPGGACVRVTVTRTALLVSLCLAVGADCGVSRQEQDAAAREFVRGYASVAATSPALRYVRAGRVYSSRRVRRSAP